MKIVVALGGNALQSGGQLSQDNQLNTCKSTAKCIIDLVKSGHQIAVVHGNGPQIGGIYNSISAAHHADSKNSQFSFDVCGSFTQGYIGYHLQNALNEQLAINNINKSVASVVSQVEVDPNDPGFSNPTKPIGSFYSKEEAEKLQAKSDFIMREDSGRGWRRVVPSPKPINIIEKHIIQDIFNSGNIVIAAGGGGIPVVKQGSAYKGVEAVIDKDLSATKLAELINADLLVILTAVDKVYINFNTPEQEELNKVSLNDLDGLISKGYFAPGSMLPKIEAIKEFLSLGQGKKAIITSLEKIALVLDGSTDGTWFEQ